MFNNENRIVVSGIKYTIKIINYSKNNEYIQQLENLYCSCEPKNIFNNKFENTKIFIIFDNDTDRNANAEKIIGFLFINPLIERNEKRFFKNPKNGLYISKLCGDSNYKGISAPLFQEVYKYARMNKYKFVGLLVKKERHWVVNLYKKLGLSIMRTICKTIHVMRKDL